ncbi:ABC transporter ATP-binding protein [Deinococcus fonticola]|uniref:ABC transporter ATP-binding protein n=1 Tax=Deinococcus fonticola TaxID=2528713 RepID=UPI00107505AB|nr:ABC transporter ATP-binding protein [Deinococcus fonticola]
MRPESASPESGPPESALLEVTDLHGGYGSARVLHGLSFRVGKGETHALLGRNGMGKTTTVRTLMGLNAARSGRILFDGQDMTKLSPEAVVARGLAVVPEGRQVFPNLSVEEHLIAFHLKRHGNHWTPGRVYELFPRLHERRHHGGQQLSGGEQQMLAIGRALITNPKLLILDEATEGLAPLMREEVWRCLTLLRESGQSILVIDKYVRRLMTLADQHTILERGQVVWQGNSAQLEADKTAWEYLSV